MCRAALRALIAGASLAFAPPVAAQVFEYAAGASSLLRARGASVQVHGGSYTACLGVGFEERTSSPHVGATLESSVGGWKWIAGDRSVPLSFPTDMFSGVHQFNARGLSVARRTSRTELLVFGGATANGYSTPFFHSATPRDRAALVYYDHELRAGLRGFSRSVISDDRTSIHGLQWSPSPACQLGLAAGMGSDEPYGAGSVKLELPRASFRSAYTRMGAGFRRLPAEGLGFAEPDRENLQLDLVPWSNVRLGLGRRHHAASSGGEWISRATTGAQMGVSLAGLRLSGDYHRSDGATGAIQGSALGVQRASTSGFEAGATFFHSRSGGQTHQSVAAQCRERPVPYLSLSQVVTYSRGRTTLAIGGQLALGRAQLGVDHQTTYVPLAPAGQPAFRRALMLNLRLPLMDSARLSAATQVDAMGQVRYTASVGGFAYGKPIAARATAQRRVAASGVSIGGSVVDTSGKAVAGAAVRVAGQLVFTDSHGGFAVRLPRAKSYAIELVLDEFMFPGSYEVVSAPQQVRSASGVIPEVRIVLRRVR